MLLLNCALKLVEEIIQEHLILETFNMLNYTSTIVACRVNVVLATQKFEATLSSDPIAVQYIT